MNHNNFKTFLKSLKNDNNSSLIESIQKGYNILFEDEETDAILDIMNMTGKDFHNAQEQYYKTKGELSGTNEPTIPLTYPYSIHTKMNNGKEMHYIIDENGVTQDGGAMGLLRFRDKNVADKHMQRLNKEHDISNRDLNAGP